jgi:sulfur relay (sulfurtransferase) DsrC/TusE family protein
MSKDPAFLFYDGDAAKDVSHMNRLERGCYFDLIQAIRKFHRITVEQARKILGKDFDECWGALELILKQEDGKYFIEWIEESVNKRTSHSEKQKKKIEEYWRIKKSIPRNNHGNTTVLPLENENENEIENEKEREDENEKKVFHAPPKKSARDACDLSGYPDLFIEALDCFIDHRKKLKKPMFENAIRLTIKKLNELAPDDYDTQIKILEQSIQQGWQGIFELKENFGSKQKLSRREEKAKNEYPEPFIPLPSLI